MKSLCILTPVRDSMPGPATHAVFDLGVELTRRGVDVVRKSTWLSSSLPHSRMQLAHEALDTGAERILFLDDDIMFTTSDADRLAERVTDDDIIAGAYKARIEGGMHVGAPLQDGGAFVQEPPLLGMSSVGLGFTMTTRAALTRMVATYGERCFAFEMLGDDLVGEDVSFCRKWRELGGRVWLHTQVQLGHVGPHIFR